MRATGYLHPGYAGSFRGYAETVRLDRAGGWLLRRGVGGGPYFDLAGTYPLFLCRQLSEVPRDLADLDSNDLASAVFVTDPFFEGSVVEALEGFDLVQPFKSHHVARLDAPWRKSARRSCKYFARKARRELEIGIVADPASRGGGFWDLYREILERHRVKGPARLSPEIVAAQLRVPGATLFEVKDSASILGLMICYEIDDRAYAHLLGMSPEGRQRLAAYGLFEAALDHYQGRVAWLDLGGNAGTLDEPEDGLSRFKKGWASDTRTSYLCGKVLNRRLYDSLCAAFGGGDTAYFPAYRAGES